MRRVLLGLCFAIFASGVARGMPPIKEPDCRALEAWGARVNTQTYNLAPRLQLPRALADDMVVPLFGIGVLSWSRDDLQAANRILTQCYVAAGQRRDAAAAGALANGNRALQGLVPRTQAILEKAKTDAAPLERQIAALPDSPGLDRGIAALIKIDPVRPDVTPFHALPREVADPLWRLASQVLPVLADSERDALFKKLGERHRAIQSGMVAVAEKKVADAPADAGGMLELMAVPQEAAAIEDGGTRAGIEQKAGDRLKQIGEALRGAKPAVWIPPSCAGFYRWSGGAGASAVVAVGNRMVVSVLLDPSIVPVFGLSLADWSDADLAHFKALRALCQNAWQAEAARPGGNPPEMAQLANRARWVEGADRTIADAKAALAGYRSAQQALAAALEKARALPNTASSMPALAQIAREPAQAMVTQEERARFLAALNQKEAAIAANASEAAIKGLSQVKLASLDDLKDLVAYFARTLPTIPDARQQEAFRNAFARTLQEAANRLLPETKARLAAAPATLARVAAANITLLKLDATAPRFTVTPAWRIYYKAMEENRDALAGSARAQACAAFVSGVGAGSEAKQELWNGQDGMTLGEFLCEADEHGIVNSYSGPGFFSSTTTVKVTPFKSQILTIALHKVEVKAGKPMLVGYEVKDAAQASGAAATPPNHFQVTPNGPLTVEGWELFISNVIGMSGLEPPECFKVIDNPEPDKLDPAKKVFWLHCWTFADVRAHVARRLTAQQ